MAAIDGELARIYSENYTYLLRFALTKTRDRHTAEDMVQNACLHRLRCARYGDISVSLLIHSTQQRFNDHYRQRKFRMERVRFVSLDVARGEAAPSGTAQTEARALAEWALAQMTERERRIFRLLAQGYSYPETARLLGMNLNTLKRAVANARSHLTDEHQDKLRRAVHIVRTLFKSIRYITATELALAGGGNGYQAMRHLERMERMGLVVKGPLVRKRNEAHGKSYNVATYLPTRQLGQ